MKTRWAVLLGAGALPAIALAVLWYLGIVLPSRGPLGDAGGNQVGKTVREGETLSPSFVLPENPTDGPLELQSVSVLGRSGGLKVLGWGVWLGCKAGPVACPSHGIFNHWPPHLGRMTKVEGFVVSPGEEAHLVVGLQPQRRGTQWMEGLILEYRQGVRRFQTEIGPRVVVRVGR